MLDDDKSIKMEASLRTRVHGDTEKPRKSIAHRRATTFASSRMHVLSGNVQLKFWSLEQLRNCYKVSRKLIVATAGLNN